MDAYVDAKGHSYIVDGEHAYVTVHGTTYTMTLAEARGCWTASQRAAQADSPTAEALESARRSLHGW